MTFSGNITVLSGGVGGARFLQGLLRLEDVDVTVIANTGDDLWVHGLKVCPDLDTVMYTLGDGIDTERGWGRKAETFHAKEELAAYGVEPTWFGLGDRDIATHLVRTQMLEAGYPLSAVTAALCKRWQPGVTLLPMSELANRVAELEPHRDGEIVVHCHHGGRSLRVAMWLRNQGFARVSSLAGGIDLWSQQIDPGVPRY